MNPTEIAQVVSLCRARAGLLVAPDKTYLMESRLAPVARREGYESISEDLRAIVKRNEHISQRLRLDPIIWKKIHRPDNTVEQPSDANLALYRQVRFIQLSDRVIQGLMKNFGLDVPLSACRLSNQRVEGQRRLPWAQQDSPNDGLEQRLGRPCRTDSKKVRGV